MKGVGLATQNESTDAIFGANGWLRGVSAAEENSSSEKD
jgi:hypothetical protein